MSDLREISPKIRRLLAQVPEDEIENWLKSTHPELFRGKSGALESLRRAPKTKPAQNPLKVLRKDRENR